MLQLIRYIFQKLISVALQLQQEDDLAVLLKLAQLVTSLAEAKFAMKKLKQQEKQIDI